MLQEMDPQHGCNRIGSSTPFFLFWGNWGSMSTISACLETTTSIGERLSPFRIFVAVERLYAEKSPTCLPDPACEYRVIVALMPWVSGYPYYYNFYFFLAPRG